MRPGFPGVQIHNNRNVIGEQAVGSGALVERKRLPFAQDLDAGHGDFYQRGIEFDIGAASCGEDASPVGIATGESSLDERRCGDGFGNFAGGGFGAGAADFNFDDALGAFAVGDNLLGKTAADLFECG